MHPASRLLPALALLLAAAPALRAEPDAAPRIGTVDMEIVVLAHPSTAANKTVLLDLQKRYTAERDAKRDELRALVEKGRKAAESVRDPALSAAKRAAAAAEVDEIDEKLREGDAALRALVADRQSKLRAKENELFGNVMADIRVQLDAIAKAHGLDLVLDKSATRTTAPIPIVVWSAPALDLTDEAVAATKGDRAAAEKALAEADAQLTGLAAEAGADAE